MFEFVIRNQGFPTITIYAQEVTDTAALPRTAHRERVRFPSCGGESANQIPIRV
jgi:hypothetical protein